MIKQINWQTIIVVGLILALGLTIIFGKNSLNEAKKLTKELELRVDTLRDIENEYKILQHEYANLYSQFITSKEQIEQFRKKVNDVSATQKTSLSLIRNKLNKLILEYDTMGIDRPLDSLSLDSLRF